MQARFDGLGKATAGSQQSSKSDGTAVVSEKLGLGMVHTLLQVRGAGMI